jgi:cytochrome c biogenesis protein CcdA
LAFDLITEDASMLELLLSLFPILLIDILNPVLLALLVFAAGSNKPFINSLAMLLGHTLTYFLAGYLLSFGVERISEWISEWMSNPGTVDYVLGALVGVWCVVWFLKPGKPSAEPELPNWNLTPIKCFFFGAVINMMGLPFAIPYLGAIDQILKADLSLYQSFAILGIYNLGYALPFAVVPASVLVLGERSKPILEKLNDTMVSASTKIMPWLILALGIWLIFDTCRWLVSDF